MRRNAYEVAILIATALKDSCKDKVRISEKQLKKFIKCPGTLPSRLLGDVSKELETLNVSLIKGETGYLVIHHSVIGKSTYVDLTKFLPPGEPDFEALEDQLLPEIDETDEQIDK